LVLNSAINKSGTVLTVSGPGQVVVNGVIAGGSTGTFNSDLVISGGTAILNQQSTYLWPNFCVRRRDVTKRGRQRPARPHRLDARRKHEQTSPRMTWPGSIKRLPDWSARAPVPLQSQVRSSAWSTLTIDTTSLTSGSAAFGGVIGGETGQLKIVKPASERKCFPGQILMLHDQRSTAAS